MSENNQLNILDIFSLRRDHWHKSIDSSFSSDIVIPAVHSYMQYDSPTITRVTKQFASNIERIVSYVLKKESLLRSTNLSNYITMNLEESENADKIFVSPPCAMTSQRLLAVKNCTDVNAEEMPRMLKVFMMEDFSTTHNIIIGITEAVKNANGKIITPNRIVRYDLGSKDEMDTTSTEMVEIYSSDVNIEFKQVGYADINQLYLYVITNKDIRLFKVHDLNDLDRNLETNPITYCNIVDFANSYSDDKHRYNDNLIVEDIYRRNRIIDLIVSGSFHSFVDKYFKLGEFPEDVLQPSNWSIDPIKVFDVGIVTGKFGVYLIHCYSTKPKNVNEFEADGDPENNIPNRGSLHIRCLDNKPVKDAFFYEDNGQKFLIAINGWPKSDENNIAVDSKYKGVTVFKLDEAVAAGTSFTYDSTRNAEITDADVTTPVPADGYLCWEGETSGININQVLNSRGLNGAYVNNLFYKQVEDYETIYGYKARGFILRYTSRYYDLTDMKHTMKSYFWFVALNDQQLYNIKKCYDRPEFNCFAEYKISNAMYHPGTHTGIFDIKDVGLIQGIQEHDKDGNAGFRFNILKPAYTYDDINSITVMNRCFVAATDKKIYFIISNGDVNEAAIGTNIYTGVKNIEYACSHSSSNILCIGDNSDELGISRIGIISMKYVIDTNTYTELITQNLSNLISTNFLSKDNAVSTTIDNHIKELHNKDTIIYKLNDTLSLLEGRSKMQQTGFSDNLRVSYITLNYPNKGYDFSYIETDENSTDIYGRINSKTVNSNPLLMTTMKRNSNAITYYDTVSDAEGHTLLSTNKVVYSTCKLSERMMKLTVNVPSTGTYYVDNILGWSSGSRTGSSLSRKSLDDGYIQGQIENCTTHYQLILNRVFFNIKEILNVTAQLASAPLRIYSNKTEFDIRHYGMYDCPAIAPLNMNSMTDDYTYDMSAITNDEIVLSFSIFGGDALVINILIENYEE